MLPLHFLSLLTQLAVVFSDEVIDLRVSNVDIAPDGFTRPAVLVNSQFPAPLIRGYKGQRLRMNVIDNLIDRSMLRSTTIHWHGIFQHGSSWADGTAFVSQCPISPGHSFLYDFSVQDQAGTYFYHSHIGSQMCDGLKGPMVIYDPDDPHKELYDVDDESTVITLSDWYHIPSLLVPRDSSVSNSTLINGLGRYAGGPSSPMTVINVERGKRYRFRLISLACQPHYVFSIDGHDMEIIEVDGVSVKPVNTTALRVWSGQRWSFVLHADREEGDTFLIRADPSKGPKGFDNGINSAILRYVSSSTASVLPSTSLVLGHKVYSAPPTLPESALVPLETPGVSRAPPDYQFTIDVTFDGSEYKMNGKTFRPPSVPVLLQILSGKRDAHDLLPKGSVFGVKRNKVVEVTLNGWEGSNHPIHLHGHTFDIIRLPGEDFNYDTSPRRDVVNMGVVGQSLTIQFKTDNSGPWMLHCHVDSHLEAGFAIIFAEDTTHVSSQQPNETDAVPASWNELCPIYNQENMGRLGVQERS